MNKKISIALLACMFCFTISHGQKKQRQEVNTPKWVTMMNDPNSNYFKTLGEFRKFWKGKALPEEPFEDKEMDVFEREVGLINDETDHEERERIEKEAREKRKNENPDTRSYAAEVRAFKGWMQHIKPWVLEDGSIVNLDDQQKLIDKQREDLNQIEKQNKR